VAKNKIFDLLYRDLKIAPKKGKMELDFKKENQYETIRNIYLHPVDDKFDGLRWWG
jgi:hypothetical protein